MTPFQPRDRVHLKGHPHTTHTTGTVRSIDDQGAHVLWDDGEVVTAQLPLYLEPAGEPMSQTFASIAPGSLLELEVRRGAALDERLIAEIRSGTNCERIALDPADAPALALAILEAAGFQNVPHDSANGAEKALGYLIEYVGLQRANAKAAADREALEAEAWELYVARNGGESSFGKFADLAEANQRNWISVAKAARTLHGVTS